jgi:glycosyltransferase involved in cell wall biosynthesis
MSEVVRQISERLAARGHEVIVATRSDPQRGSDVINGVSVQSFDVTGKSAVGVYGDIHGYQKFLLENDADVVVNFAAQQWATDLVFPLLENLPSKKVFVPTGFSALGDPLFASYFEKMKDWMQLYDACVFLSDEYRDIKFARKAGITKCAIIPNAAAQDEFDRPKDQSLRRRLGILEGDFLIIHVAGYLSVAKGQIEAVRMFGESNIQNATLLLICGEFSEGLLSGVHPRKLARGLWQLLRGRGFSGFVPAWQIALRKWLQRKGNRATNRQILTASLSREDTVSAFLDADLFLFPSWIECSPLVLFEAAASETPFLVTDVGNSREIIKWTGGGELLPGTRKNDIEGSFIADVNAGAQVLDKLWENPAKRAAMGASAHKAWKENFQWEKIANRYEELYMALLRGEDIRGRFNAPPDAQCGVV